MTSRLAPSHAFYLLTYLATTPLKLKLVVTFWFAFVVASLAQHRKLSRLTASIQSRSFLTMADYDRRGGGGGYNRKRRNRGKSLLMAVQAVLAWKLVGARAPRSSPCSALPLKVDQTLSRANAHHQYR